MFAIAARRGTQEAGATLVEFNLVLLPLFAILFLTMDVARFIFGWAALQSGAREGVRYAVTASGQSEGTVDAATKLIVEQYSFGFAQPSNITINYYSPTDYSSSGAPTSLDGTSGATSIGNVITITVRTGSLGTFGAIYRSFSPVQLTASAADMMQ